ncbi:MAG: NUDIX pyrophosphatase [candidate division Zixibacteria bacterium]|nr:NUDIX pyrophosphatase [candidate division Zixibacteria bacterium]
MDRAPFQVLIFPYRVLPNDDILYAVFRRDLSTGGYWQGIAGGGAVGESELEAARREANEEAGIDLNSEYVRLDCYAMIPVVNVCGFKWGKSVLVIPEYCFGVRIKHENLILSSEHMEYQWVTYQEALDILHWDSNKSALWELDYRLREKIGYPM